MVQLHIHKGRITIMSKNITADTQFKDASPAKTVERIKDILSSHGIKTLEAWGESGIEHCFSLRVTVEGTKFGTNGKGLTRELALASAYGELMERMQLGLFGDSSVQKLGYFSYAVGADSRETADTLYSEMPYWYDYLADKVSELDSQAIDGKRIISRFASKDGRVDAVRFYSLTRGRTVLVPRDLRCLVCGSNGGAAGNTMEEAVVQAVSEIVERYYKQRILRERISLPELPEEVIRSYPTAHGIIESVRRKGYRVTVMDCSLGTRFPVVAVCYVDERTGRYHTHFGAYPKLEIALERALTESFQGRSIDGFAKNESFLYSKNDVFSYQNVYRDLKQGDYLKTPEFFVGECAYEYNPNVGFNGESNAELLSEVIEFIHGQGCEILVRDASSLGFPTYNVFIPTYSEVVFYGLSKRYFSNPASSKTSAAALRDLSRAGMGELLFLLAHLEEMKRMGSVSENIFSFANCANLRLDCPQSVDQYLMNISLAYVYYSLGDHALALSALESLPTPAADSEYLLCLRRYLSMLVNRYDRPTAERLIKYFHSGDSVGRLMSHLDAGTNPFSELILRCDGESCSECRVEKYCKQRYTRSLVDLVNEGARRVDFDGFVAAIEKYSVR